MAGRGLPDDTGLNHRLPHFQHGVARLHQALQVPARRFAPLPAGSAAHRRRAGDIGRVERRHAEQIASGQRLLPAPLGVGPSLFGAADLELVLAQLHQPLRNRVTALRGHCTFCGSHRRQCLPGLVFKDGHFKVIELPEKLFVGPDLVYCALPERERVMTLAYTNREATYLKRFTLGGTILNKIYHLIPPKSKILFFEPDTPAELFIKYKPAPYQKINQQTCRPGDLAVKGAKSRGNQLSIKEVCSINSKPSRGWDPEAPTTQLQFA